MTNEHRQEMIRNLLDSLNWLTSEENRERMEDKGKNAIGIVVDAILMCLDFAEEQRLDVVGVLDFVIVQAAMERGDPDQDDLLKVWKVIDKIHVRRSKTGK